MTRRRERLAIWKEYALRAPEGVLCGCSKQCRVLSPRSGITAYPRNKQESRVAGISPPTPHPQAKRASILCKSLEAFEGWRSLRRDQICIGE